LELPEELVSIESADPLRTAFLRSLERALVGPRRETMAMVGDVLNGAVLEDALPGLAAGLDGELDALVLAEAGRGRGGSGVGRGFRHCGGLLGVLGGV
jgi:hypothetical protein